MIDVDVLLKERFIINLQRRHRLGITFVCLEVIFCYETLKYLIEIIYD